MRIMVRCELYGVSSLGEARVGWGGGGGGGRETREREPDLITHADLIMHAA